MNFLVFLAVLGMIGVGVMMLAFPDAYRAWVKFGNDWEGVKTEQGELFEVRRVLGGVVLIITGIFLLVLLIRVL